MLTPLAGQLGTPWRPPAVGGGSFQTVARVQYKHNYNVSATFTSNVQVGNVIVVAASMRIGNIGQLPDISSVTDNLGNTYTRLRADASNPASGHLCELDIWVAPITTGGACTVSFSCSTGYDGGMTVVEYSGVTTTVDASGTMAYVDASTDFSVTLTLSQPCLVFAGNSNECDTTSFSWSGADLINADYGHVDTQAESMNVPAGSKTVSNPSYRSAYAVLSVVALRAKAA